MNALRGRGVGSRKKESESEVVENQLFELVGTIKNLIANRFFGPLFSLDLTDNAVDTFTVAFTIRETLLVNFGR